MVYMYINKIFFYIKQNKLILMFKNIDYYIENNYRNYLYMIEYYVIEQVIFRNIKVCVYIRIINILKIL